MCICGICSLISCCLSCISRARLAVIFLWAAAVLCSISIVSPFWLIKQPATVYDPAGIFSQGCPREDIGLLAKCCATKDKCTWVWEDKFKLEADMPGWFKAIQCLFLAGFILLLPALILSPFRFCCQCGKQSVGISKILAVFTFLAACLFLSAVSYFLYNVLWAQLTFLLTLTTVATQSWAYSMGFVGACFTFASFLFWFFDSKREIRSVTFQHQDKQPRGRRGFLKL